MPIVFDFANRLGWLTVLALVGAGTAHADGSFFFQDQTQPQRQRATFSDQERDKLLQDAYACNRPGKTPEEQQRCQEREARAREIVSERTRANHQLAEPQLQELRQLYRQQPR
ncbi:hypothetical protein [Sulfuricystis multivorans]|uniref:hypothetical protein n=1 Tax=Sulfuricystis multivorans TaxID=2211108 RepID=UPI000F8363BF|nr:hypothetical protein [Sulfuricystis multivorans]